MILTLNISKVDPFLVETCGKFNQNTLNCLVSKPWHISLKIKSVFLARWETYMYTPSCIKIRPNCLDSLVFWMLCFLPWSLFLKNIGYILSLQWHMCPVSSNILNVKAVYEKRYQNVAIINHDTFSKKQLQLRLNATHIIIMNYHVYGGANWCFWIKQCKTILHGLIFTKVTLCLFKRKAVQGTWRQCIKVSISISKQSKLKLQNWNDLLNPAHYQETFAGRFRCQIHDTTPHWRLQLSTTTTRPPFCEVT